MIPATPAPTREALYDAGLALLSAFFAANPQLPPARVARVAPKAWRFPSTCAYWRDDQINICVERCAHPAPVNLCRAWSWPGYAVDRTPYGVLAHEVGHHLDWHLSPPGARDRYRGAFSRDLRAATRLPPLTGYAPDDGEWWAEYARLYLTNPSLLLALAPPLYDALTHRGVALPPEHSPPRSWHTVLAGAPPRILAAAERRVASRKELRP